ncbi:Transposase IS4 [Popillia japonica]|uniref:Transposase IS4 n=1 Tax=Popillia japonica TaxID=7064 RepID=A0AAW1K398_POPJA
METDSDYEPSVEDELEQSGSSSSEDELSDVESDGEEYEDLMFQATQWCEIDTTLPISPAPPRFPFEGTPGISSNINFEEDINNCTLQFFNLFFDDELVNEIALQTNIYAGQVRTEGNAKSQWRDVTINEIRLFLAINIMQSVVKKPNLQDYWSRNPIIETPFVRKMMPYKRFVTIKQYLRPSASLT